jgi:hypothetical protein
METAVAQDHKRRGSGRDAALSHEAQVRMGGVHGGECQPLAADRDLDAARHRAVEEPDVLTADERKAFRDRARLLHDRRLHRGQQRRACGLQAHHEP